MYEGTLVLVDKAKCFSDRERLKDVIVVVYLHVALISLERTTLVRCLLPICSFARPPPTLESSQPWRENPAGSDGVSRSLITDNAKSYMNSTRK